MSQAQTNDENPPPAVVTQPTASPPLPQRKVSIANDPVKDSHYDNLAYEPSSKQQKTSQVSQNNFILTFWQTAVICNRLWMKNV